MTFIIDPKKIENYLVTAARDFDPSDNYIASYPQILAASKILLESMGPSGIPAIAFMAYGWMPTILRYNINKNNNEILFSGFQVSNQAGAYDLIQGLNESPVNNSWVGLSKVLHFINPNFFPIWDSKVARHFNRSNSYQMGKKSNYLNYLSFIHDNIEMSYVQNFRKKVKNKFFYEMTCVRVLEFALFVNEPELETFSKNNGT